VFQSQAPGFRFNSKLIFIVITKFGVIDCNPALATAIVSQTDSPGPSRAHRGQAKVRSSLRGLVSGFRAVLASTPQRKTSRSEFDRGSLTHSAGGPGVLRRPCRHLLQEEGQDPFFLCLRVSPGAHFLETLAEDTTFPWTWEHQAGAGLVPEGGFEPPRCCHRRILRRTDTILVNCCRD